MAKKNAPRRGALAQELIDDRARLYDVFRDPFRAWEVYFLARSAGLDVPAWVSSYLDRVAGRMVALSIAIEEGAAERTLADALELGRAKQSVAWKRAALRRRRQYAIDVLTLVQTKGYTKSRAIDLVAQIHKRDPDKDRRGTIALAVKDITKHGWRLAGGRGGPPSWPAPSAAVLQIRPRQSDRSK